MRSKPAGRSTTSRISSAAAFNSRTAGTAAIEIVLTGLRQADAACRAVEERQHSLFELAYRLADGGRRNPEPTGRCRKAPLLRHHQECDLSHQHVLCTLCSKSHLVATNQIF